MSSSSTPTIHSNRRVATGVVGVMRRAEERRRRQQIASAHVGTYIAAHNLPNTIDRIVGTLIAERPSDPLLLMEQLLRQLHPDGSRIFGSGNGYNASASPPVAAPPHDGVAGDSEVTPCEGGGEDGDVSPTHEAARAATPPGTAEDTVGCPDTVDEAYYSIPNDPAEEEDGEERDAVAEGTA